MTTTSDAPVEFSFGDRYRSGAGPVLLTGVQAIVRLLVEQHTADAAAGLTTASFVSGYQGSPLGGLDTTLAAAHDELADSAGLRFVPGVNEELAATAVWGSQVEVPDHPRTVDGAVGVWYGKAPGVDRAGDPMRHGNICGAHPNGGVLVLAGDDPGCKSSTIPCISERALYGYGLPVLYPGTASDIVRLGRYGIALSRASGMWVGMKIVADVADGLATVGADAASVDVTVPELEWEGRRWEREQVPMLAPPASLRAEEALYGPRTAMLQEFLAANPINTVEVASPGAWLGIVAGGKAFTDVRQALLDLGLGDDELAAAGIRLMRLGMISPIERAAVRSFADGCETVLVVEEKTPFVETGIRDALYGMASAPAVIGSSDSSGRPLVPSSGELTAAALAGPLRRVLAGRVSLVEPRRSLPSLELLPVARTPYFCSGCPHNRSTVVPSGAVAGGGIGCHAMVALTGREESLVTSITQMGGEGAQWIGQAPFTAAGHMFQNMGDGTFAHSGQLAVQACVAAGVDITYKLLYNRAVAMTGGQDAEGGLAVPALCAKLLAEGISKIIICADEPARYRALDRLPRGVDLWSRDRFADAQTSLAATPGVTVLIYDQRCAAESRRLRKRGEIPVRPTRVVINEAVCEGCGDCGAKSNCLSVQPVATDLGRKTRIDQSSCNTDYSCLDGDCPSFVTVQAPATRPARPGQRSSPLPVPDVEYPPAGDVFLAGIGGTGIVTVNQVLASAAVRDGRAVHGLDQTGLSQKAGPVVSHLRVAASGSDLGPANRVGAAGAYLAFDALVGADSRYLTAAASPDVTTAVVSTSRTPTGSQVRDPSVAATDPDGLLERIAARTASVVAVDASSAALALFGDTMPANLLLVGAAYQSGVLPISASAIEWAIELNGVAVAANTAAFRWGRVAVADCSAFAVATASPRGSAAGGAGGAGTTQRSAAGGAGGAGTTRRSAAGGAGGAGTTRRSAAGGAGGARTTQRSAAGEALSSEAPVELPAGMSLDDLADAPDLVHIVRRRAAELVGFQDAATARRYVADVRTVRSAERAAGVGSSFSEAAADGLYRLTAYKDEYEVARLLTDPAFEARLAVEVPGGTRMRYRLHPPVLRSLGRRRKIAFGPWMRPVLRGLARGKVLRGTALDPFGRTGVRRLERELRDGYRAMVLRLAGSLRDGTVDHDTAAAAARAAEEIRGYEDVKLAGVERYRSRLTELGLDAG